MNIRLRAYHVFTNDWFLAFGLLLIFLMANGYTYGWDDQHLEIPLLKGLIDPGLYSGDYYVEGLKKNFTSILYPILAQLITVKQIPAAYLFLYLISRYFLFFWMLRIWKVISGHQFPAFVCVAALLSLGRVEEFLYRTFSHQEFALAGIFAGIYFFYKERYLLASFILGLFANVHAIYALFPFGYLIIHLLSRRPFFKQWKISLIATAGFCAGALPFIIWSIVRYLSRPTTAQTGLDDHWMELYLLACPQNFAFGQIPLREIVQSWASFWKATSAYGILAIFTALTMTFSRTLREDNKSKAVLMGGTLGLLISLIFTSFFPQPFILDLNLVRNAQFMLFVLTGYLMILFIELTAAAPLYLVWLFTALIPLIRFGDTFMALTGGGMFLILALNHWLKKAPDLRQKTALWVLTAALIALLVALGFLLKIHAFNKTAWISLGMNLGLASVLALTLALKPTWRNSPALRRIFILIPLTVFFVHTVYYHAHHLRMERQSTGFWQLQRNWIDMQNYVRDHTPRNALLLVPYDMEMGGFRIFSERKVLVCYRDCGIIGFDYPAAVEWRKRIKDVEAFQVFINQPITQAFINAITKYKVNYIVFMGYNAPVENGFLKQRYKNDAFVLYEIPANPVPVSKAAGSAAQDKGKPIKETP